jgi:hypothetical protein
MSYLVICIPGILLAAGAFWLFAYTRRRRTLYEMVPADAGDPAQMPREEWREKYKNWEAQGNKKAVGIYLVFATVVILGTLAVVQGPRVVAALQPTPTSTSTPTITPTPRPTRTPTPTYWPEEIVMTRTPRPGTGTPTVQASPTVRVIYQAVTQIVIRTKIVYVTVVVTATSTFTVTPTFDWTPTFTSTPTETPTPTFTVTSTPTPTGTLTETPTPTPTGATP